MGTAPQEWTDKTDEASRGDEEPAAQEPSTDEPTHELPSRDEFFHVLRNQRRRFAIHYLKNVGEPVDVGDLATQVAAWENDVSVEEVTSEQRRRVYNALQQTHVPELDDTGIVETERREVELTAQAMDLDVYLEMVPGPDIPWSQYYLALGLIGAVITTLTTFNVGPLGAIPDLSAAVFLTVALLLSALANYYFQHGKRLGAHEKPPELRGA